MGFLRTFDMLFTKKILIRKHSKYLLLQLVSYQALDCLDYSPLSIMVKLIGLELNLFGATGSS